MKKLQIIYLFLAVVSTAFTSCSYQNYSSMQAQLAPLTNDSYTANTGWNADHYNVTADATTKRPPRQVAPRPVYQGTIVTTK